MIPTSMPRCPEISAAVAPMCGFARLSSWPRPAARHRRRAMKSLQQVAVTKSSIDLSRRSLLTGGLAAGFVLAFHLPLRAAVNEPVQPADTTDGKFAPNAFIRIDQT